MLSFHHVNDEDGVDQVLTFEVYSVVQHFAFYALFSISSFGFETKSWFVFRWGIMNAQFQFFFSLLNND